ncbi:hypothetical protein AB0B31_36600 [Catellatospora citrea]|uniref:hypothetical protein n=1 Tax=Catellatospora citrea TaxID=53366 RepID=UPI0033EB3064
MATVRRLHPLLIAAVFGITAAVAPLAVRQAHAEPTGPSLVRPTISNVGLPPGFASWKDLFDVQEVLDAAATRLEDVAQATAGSGFTSVEVDAPGNALTVHWKGKPSAREDSVLSAIRGSGIKVRLQPARYSQLELDAQVALIEKDAAASGDERVASITKQPDGSGVRVTVSSVATRANRLTPGAPAAGLGLSLGHLQAAKAHGSVTVVAATDTADPRATREADSPYYWGGALYRYNVGSGQSVCSTGFAVHWPLDGTDYMTTAAHCRDTNAACTAPDWCGHRWTFSGGRDMGIGTPGGSGYDMMFIRTPGGATGNIYTGAPATQTPQGYMPVRRASHTHIGDSLCTSGAYTGWHCYIRASGPTRDCRAWVAPIGLGSCFNVEGGITTVEGQLIMGKGDSGGPVWTPINGFNRPDSAADARGLISSLPDGWNWISCTDRVQGGTSVCATAVWFTDVVSAIQPWVSNGGMYVKTQ